jgi:hypothetical protein
MDPTCTKLADAETTPIATTTKNTHSATPTIVCSASTLHRTHPLQHTPARTPALTNTTPTTSVVALDILDTKSSLLLELPLPPKMSHRPTTTVRSARPLVPAKDVFLPQSLPLPTTASLPDLSPESKSKDVRVPSSARYNTLVLLAT